MIISKCRLCGNPARIDEGQDNVCKKHILEINADAVKKAVLKARKVVEIADNQGRLKEFRPMISKVAKSKKTVHMYATMPLLEILIDLELHLRGIKHEHQYGAGFPNYRLDFYINKYGIGLEADDKGHKKSKAKAHDFKRDWDFEIRRTIPVVRIKEIYICSDVRQAVDDAIEKGKRRKKHLESTTEQDRYFEYFRAMGV